MKKTIPIFLLSNSSNSIFIDNVRKNTFSTTLDNPIFIQEGARNCYLSLRMASIVNFFYNISATLGNNILYFTDDVGLPQKYTITIPDGAYEVSQLNLTFKNWLLNNGFSDQDLTLIEDVALQKVIISVASNRGIQIPTGLGQVLGFNNTPIFNSSGSTLFYTAQNVAKFNNVISLCVDTSLCSSNLYNGKLTNLIAVVPINVPVSSIILYDPQTPLKIPADNLINNSIYNISINILDQNRNPVEIIENYSILLEIEYDI